MSEHELKFKRYLYLTTETACYVASKNLNHSYFNNEHKETVLQLVEKIEVKTIINIINSVNKENLCSRRDTVLFVLAVCSRCSNNTELKHAAYGLVLNTVKTTEELFLYIKFAHDYNKNFSHGLKRIVCDYYLKNTNLANVLTHQKSFFGWSHKDVLKMIHAKPTDPAQEVLLTYTIKNLDEAKKKIDAKPTDAVKKILDKLNNIETLKHCQDEKQAANLIRSSKLSLMHVPLPLHKSQIVWEALIPHLQIPELLQLLGRLAKLRCLKPLVKEISAVLSDVKKCRACKIHPFEVLVWQQTMLKGKPIDPKNRAYYAQKADKPLSSIPKYKKNFKFEPLHGPVQKLLSNSYQNTRSTGRRIFITVALHKDYNHLNCIPNNVVNYLDAVSVLILSYAYAEKSVTVAVFNGTSISLVEIQKDMPMADLQARLLAAESSFVLLTSPLQWAMTNKRSSDVFINCIYQADTLLRVPKEHRARNGTVLTVLSHYRRKLHLNNTKFVTISFGNWKLAVTNGSLFVFDICGFDGSVSRLLEAICKSSLQ